MSMRSSRSPNLTGVRADERRRNWRLRRALLADVLRGRSCVRSACLDKLLECQCNFNSVEILALDVLDERHFGKLRIVITVRI